MSAKNKGAKGAKAKQRAEKAKPAAATKVIPELAAMKFPAKMVAKLEALAEAKNATNFSSKPLSENVPQGNVIQRPSRFGLPFWEC